MRPDLEVDLRGSEAAKVFVRDRHLAKLLYGALCNTDWYHTDGSGWSCTWRYAGGLVADLRGENEGYMDYYCSGVEGCVDPRVASLLNSLGWKPEPAA